MSFSKGLKGDEAGAPVRSGLDAFLGKGSKVVGTLTFSGPVELDGEIEGEIIAENKLVIGESAVINAKISGTEIIVKGKVSGDITASARLRLLSTAKVTGNVSSKLIAIEEGVHFEGRCSMGNTVSPSSGKSGESSGKLSKVEASA